MAAEGSAAGRHSAPTMAEPSSSSASSATFSPDESEYERRRKENIAANARALADAILRLAQTPRVEREAMSERATQLAHSTYSRQRINAEYNRLLRQVISE